MKSFIFFLVLNTSCAYASKYFSGPRTELAPLSANVNRLLTDSESHRSAALTFTGSGFGLACIGFSPLAPIALAYASIPLFVVGGTEAGAAVALEKEAKFVTSSDIAADLNCSTRVAAPPTTREQQCRDICEQWSGTTITYCNAFCACSAVCDKTSTGSEEWERCESDCRTQDASQADVATGTGGNPTF